MMAPQVFDLSDYLADDAWHVSGVPSDKHPRGHGYAVPSPSATTGGKLARLYSLTAAAGGLTTPEMTALMLELCAAPNGGDPVPFERVVLGTALDELIADGVSASRVTVLAHLAFARWTQGEAAVRRTVEAFDARQTSAAKPAPAKKTAARKTPAKKTTRASSRSR